MNNNSNKWLNILKILTIILTVSSFIILGSKILSIVITALCGIILLAFIVILGVFTIGTIFLTPFGNDIWNTFLGIWESGIDEAIVRVLSSVYPFVVWSNFLVNILYLGISISKKSKKNIIISSIFLLVSIVMLILYLIGV